MISISWLFDVKGVVKDLNFDITKYSAANVKKAKRVSPEKRQKLIASQARKIERLQNRPRMSS